MRWFGVVAVTSCSMDEDVALTGDCEGKIVVWKILTADPIQVLHATATKDVVHWLYTTHLIYNF